MTEEIIERAIEKGARRWTKSVRCGTRSARGWTRNTLDRLYLSMDVLGIEFGYSQDTNNITACWVDGEEISRNQGERLARAKVYINIPTGELCVRPDYAVLRTQAMKYFGEFVAGQN